MTIEYTMYVTGEDGQEGKITAHGALLNVLEAALYKAGARFDKNTECWDFGFYKETARYEKRHPSIVVAADE